MKLVKKEKYEGSVEKVEEPLPNLLHSDSGSSSPGLATPHLAF
jgi:hypothetical protein